MKMNGHDRCQLSLIQLMFKIYKRTIHIDATDSPQQQLEYQVEESAGSNLSKILVILEIIAGAILGRLVFSLFLPFC
jgi:hypothetical protein